MSSPNATLCAPAGPAPNLVRGGWVAAVGVLVPSLALLLLMTGISGCSAGLTDLAPLKADAGATLGGRVHGGQQPVSGARVFLYAAGTGGAGAASRSLLSAPGYVTTDAGGSFSITGDYTCQPGDLVYLLAQGGNPGLAAGTNNAKLSLETALGPCSALTAQQNFVINEVTTVASVYALNGFQSGAGFLASNPSAAALRGLANAFAMVNVLVDVSKGTANSPSYTTGTQVPAAEINSLANAIASCVNSDGTGAPCTGLFAALSSAGSPSDTLGALVTLANVPATNPAGVYALTSANAPFQPSLTAAPNDWTVAVNFGLAKVRAQAIAIDSNGNAWLPWENASSVVELSPGGAVLSPANGFTGGGIKNPVAVAIDAGNNIWVANYGYAYDSPPVPSSVTRLDNTGHPLSPATGFTASTLNSPATIAVDGTGSVWVSGNFNSTTKFDSSGNVLSNANGFSNTAGLSSLALDQNSNMWGISTFSSVITEETPAGAASTFAIDSSPYSVAIDHNNTVWIADGAALTKVSAAGARLSPAGGYTGGGINDPTGVVVDGAGTVFAINAASINGNHSNANNLAAFSNSGTPQSGPTGYMSSYLQYPNGVAVDASGNVWVSDAGNGAVVFLGLSTPAVTPLAAGVKNGTLGTAP